MGLLAGKLHHEYYWLPLAPVAAVGVARSLELLLLNRRLLAGVVAGVLVSYAPSRLAPPGGFRPIGKTLSLPPER